MAVFTLTKDEIETPRSPKSLYHWCRAKIECIANKEGGTHALRVRQGLCKQLLEEVFPMAVWAYGLSALGDETLITPRIGPQRYDGTVVDKEGSPSEYYIEVTQAHMGKSAYFRMLHLEEKGWAPGPLSEVKLTGTRKAGKKLEAGRVTNSMSGHVQKTQELLSEALRRKLRKPYPAPTRLLVTFEDFIIRNEPDIEQLLAGVVEDSVTENGCPFDRIYLVGMSERLLIQHDVGK